MATRSYVKRIGGSSFAWIPPDVVRSLDLRPEQPVDLEIRPLGKPLASLLKLNGKYKSFPKFDRRELWGKYGER